MCLCSSLPPHEYLDLTYGVQQYRPAIKRVCACCRTLCICDVTLFLSGQVDAPTEVSHTGGTQHRSFFCVLFLGESDIEEIEAEILEKVKKVARLSSEHHTMKSHLTDKLGLFWHDTEESQSG